MGDLTPDSEPVLISKRRASDRVHLLTDFGLPAFLQNRSGLIIALFARDEDGQVLAANPDFQRLVPPPTTLDQAWTVRTLFLNPRFEDIQVLTPYHGETLLLYRGLVRFGCADQSIRSLQGHLYRWQQARLLMAAECDVEGLERLGATVLQLNTELAETRRQLLHPGFHQKRNAEWLREWMNTDPVTGVGNRRRLDERLITEAERSQRYDHPLCLLIADLDYFKSISDRCDPATGVAVLRRFALLLREHCRQSDQIARSGNEEFMIVLPDTVLGNAVCCAERIRQQLERQPLASSVGRITASFGVAMLTAGERGEDLQRRAAQALSRSKKEGRNRVTQAIAPGQVAAPHVSSC